jgi:hypothetical protein
MRRSAYAAALLLAALVTPGQRARAGLLDNPPPTLDGGQRGRVVFRMGPVLYAPGAVDTEVTCTNLTTLPVPIAVELFDERDERAGDVARVTLPPSGNATIVTSAGGATGEVVVGHLAPVEHGKARVSAPTTRISCTAQHRIKADDGSIKEVPVELVKKVAFD